MLTIYFDLQKKDENGYEEYDNTFMFKVQNLINENYNYQKMAQIIEILLNISLVDLLFPSPLLNDIDEFTSKLIDKFGEYFYPLFVSS